MRKLKVFLLKNLFRGILSIVTWIYAVYLFDLDYTSNIQLYSIILLIILVLLSKPKELVDAIKAMKIGVSGNPNFKKIKTILQLSNLIPYLVCIMLITLEGLMKMDEVDLVVTLAFTLTGVIIKFIIGTFK